MLATLLDLWRTAASLGELSFLPPASLPACHSPRQNLSFVPHAWPFGRLILQVTIDGAELLVSGAISGPSLAPLPPCRSSEPSFPLVLCGAFSSLGRLILQVTIDGAELLVSGASSAPMLNVLSAGVGNITASVPTLNLTSEFPLYCLM